MLKFEIVDGVVRGYATAVAELSFEIPVYELRECYEGEAETPEEFLDLIRDDVHRDIENHIQAIRKAKRYLSDSLKECGYYGKDEVSIIETDSIVIGEINLSEIEIEEV